MSVVGVLSVLHCRHAPVFTKSQVSSKPVYLFCFLLFWTNSPFSMDKCQKLCLCIHQLLIRSLCKLEPRDRLGYQKGGPNNIRKHRWFQTFDWQGLRATRIPSPIKPTVSGLTDTKNFDHCVEELGDPEEDKKVIAKAVPGWDAMFWGFLFLHRCWQLLFVSFVLF